MRRLLIAFTALLVLLAGAYSAYWFIMADRLRDGIAGWAAAESRRGTEVNWTSFTLGGFPFAFRASFEAPSIRADGAATPLAWQSGHLVLEALPWDLRTIRFKAMEPQTLDIGLVTDRTRIEAASSDGVIGLDSRYQAASLEARFATLRASGAGGAALATAKGVDLSLSRPETPPTSIDAPALSFGLGVEALEPTLPMALPVTGPVQIDLAGAVMGAVPEQGGEAGLAVWSEAGGTLEISRLLLDWRPVRIEGDGTLALDKALQPIGAFSTEIEGHDKLLDGMAALGWLRPEDASLGQLALSLLVREGRNGRPVVKAPLSLQDRAIYLGPLRLARMPRIVWR